METSPKLNDLLKNYFSSDLISHEPPAIEQLAQARNLVMSYKKPIPEPSDIFALVATFLNLKIKLYHAVIALLLIYAAVLFLTKQPSPIRHELSSSEPASGLVAVRNSTVLSCIQTFVSPK